MYPTSENNIVSTTAAINTRSSHKGVVESGCLDGKFMFLLLMNTTAQHLINTERKKLHAHKAIAAIH
jgi:hypothetical protein